MGCVQQSNQNRPRSVVPPECPGSSLRPPPGWNTAPEHASVGGKRCVAESELSSAKTRIPRLFVCSFFTFNVVEDYGFSPRLVCGAVLPVCGSLAGEARKQKIC